MNLAQGTFIYKAEDSIGQVYFPQTGVISLIVGLTSGQFVEAGMLGRNGVIGAGAPLDGAMALNSAIAQVESSGISGRNRRAQASCTRKRDVADLSGAA